MESKEVDKTVLEKNAASETIENESYEENSTCISKGRQPSETAPGNTLHENADSDSCEVNIMGGATAEKSAVSNVAEESLAEPVATTDSQENLNETVQEEESNKNISGSAGLEREHCEAIELPSAVTDREEILMPGGIEIDDPRIYGKWMVFTYGDMNLQDRLWIQLQDLVIRGDVILLKSSTAKTTPDHDQTQGAIMCYTARDNEAIKRAGIAIQDIVKDNIVLNYKTNEDSNKNLYRRFGNRFIAKYMMLGNGKLYERDYLDRWKKVTDSSAENHPAERNSEVCLPPNKRQKPGAELFPSRERKIQRYFYPRDTTLTHGSGIWSLFCDSIEVDSSGETELDRVWQQVVALCEEGCFSSSSCETQAFKASGPCGKPMRRTVTCELKGYTDVERVIQTGEKVMRRTSYACPMYFEVCLRGPKKKLKYYQKYLYTDDGELYEHDSKQWKLLEIKQRENICYFKF